MAGAGGYRDDMWASLAVPLLILLIPMAMDRFEVRVLHRPAAPGRSTKNPSTEVDVRAPRAVPAYGDRVNSRWSRPPRATEPHGHIRTPCPTPLSPARLVARAGAAEHVGRGGLLVHRALGS